MTGDDEEMDVLRYPIGPFAALEHPGREQVDGWIEEISALPGQARQTVKGLNGEQLSTPYRPGGWSVRQVIHHMADNDMNAYIRFKRGLTEDSPTAGSYEADLWGELADYRLPVEVSLVLMDSLHSRLTALLRPLQEQDLHKSLISPTHGPMTLEVALQRFVWHGRHHLAQIAALKGRMGW
ncbi:MAG: metal-dependent hydrolase [Paenibacillaceae bacterium]|jgi:uncharacterized damage-inducible protein DinB|nr:metal-dependent hydrolase [Paenibacillaceae bacterium]